MLFEPTKISTKMMKKQVCEDLVRYAFFVRINSEVFARPFLFSENLVNFGKIFLISFCELPGPLAKIRENI